MLVDEAGGEKCADDKGDVIGVCKEFIEEFEERDSFRRGEYLRDTALLGLIPPIFVALWGLAFLWIAAGFRQKSPATT